MYGNPHLQQQMADIDVTCMEILIYNNKSPISILSCCVFIFTFGRYIFYDTIFYLRRNNNVVIGKHVDWLCNKV